MASLTPPPALSNPSGKTPASEENVLLLKASRHLQGQSTAALSTPLKMGVKGPQLTSDFPADEPHPVHTMAPVLKMAATKASHIVQHNGALMNSSCSTILCVTVGKLTDHLICHRHHAKSFPFILSFTVLLK